MIKKIFKLLIVLLIPLTLTSLTFAADTKEERKKIVKQLTEEIVELGEKPIKKKFLQGTSDYIVILKEQRDELLKQKELKESIEAVKKDLINELEKLGEKPVTKTKEIDKDEEIIALREQLKKIKDELKKKEEAEKKKAKEKKLADDKKKEEEKKKAKKERDRNEAIQSVKKEIIFLGETPISEFEANNNDEYITALNKQLDEIKKIKEQEEKEIQQSIPGWFIKVPRGDEKVMYVRGTAVVDTLQGSIDSATNAALRELGKKLETRLNSKINETVRQAGIGEDQVTKSEMNRVSSIVVKEVTISGYEIAETKMVQLDNGSYRSFILLEYPVAQVYKAFINRIEQSPELKSSITALKETETFKELEFYVSEFTGA
ncbi:hypothetical protein N9U90_02965 [Candidatus Pelagibacter sp.]|nr:hypothetical protein [Candidatus Pelagibacter sp.]